MAPHFIQKKLDCTLRRRRYSLSPYSVSLLGVGNILFWTSPMNLCTNIRGVTSSEPLNIPRVDSYRWACKACAYENTRVGTLECEICDTPCESNAQFAPPVLALHQPTPMYSQTNKPACTFTKRPLQTSEPADLAWLLDSCSDESSDEMEAPPPIQHPKRSRLTTPTDRTFSQTERGWVSSMPEGSNWLSWLDEFHAQLPPTSGCTTMESSDSSSPLQSSPLQNLLHHDIRGDLMGLCIKFTTSHGKPEPVVLWCCVVSCQLMRDSVNQLFQGSEQLIYWRAWASGKHVQALDLLIPKMLRLNPHTTEVQLRAGLFINKHGKLEKWKLSGCNLEALPEEFGLVRTAAFLHLHDNQLERLPDSFGSITVGGALRLYGNQICVLPASFGEVTVRGSLMLRDWYGQHIGPAFEEAIGIEFSNVWNIIVNDGRNQ